MHAHLPLAAGVGLKTEHFRDAFEAGAAADGLWVEAHAENYMVDGGPRLAWLEVIADRMPVSLHGVGLSIAGPDPADPDHLERWRVLARRIRPAAVSEHLAWSVAGGAYHADLLPAFLDEATLARAEENVLRLQDATGLPVLIENPAHYAALRAAIPEPEFLRELCARTGCGLLVDLNNLVVSQNNIGRPARAYLEALPAHAIGEIHIAGASPDAARRDLLIDSHDAAVAESVWALLDHALAVFGPRPVLLERDGRVPPFARLLAERNRAQSAIIASRAARLGHGLHV